MTTPIPHYRYIVTGPDGIDREVYTGSKRADEIAGHIATALNVPLNQLRIRKATT